MHHKQPKALILGWWLPVATFNLQWSIYVHLRLALLLCSCCGGQRGALVDPLLDISEHHEHVVDPGGVACQLSDLTERGQFLCVTLTLFTQLGDFKHRIGNFLEVMWCCKGETISKIDSIKKCHKSKLKQHSADFKWNSLHKSDFCCKYHSYDNTYKQLRGPK